MEDERFQALRPIEKSWMYGNLSALRDCLERAYDAGHAAASQAEAADERLVKKLKETLDFAVSKEQEIGPLRAENAELKAKIAESEARNANISALSLERYHQIQDLIRERDQAREAFHKYVVASVPPSEDAPQQGRNPVQDSAFTLRCRCGSEYKPQCPDCHTLYAETYPVASEDAPATPQQIKVASSDYICARCHREVPENVPCPYCAEPAAQPAGKQPDNWHDGLGPSKRGD